MDHTSPVGDDAEADEPLPFSTLHGRPGLHDGGTFDYHGPRLREYDLGETRTATSSATPGRGRLDCRRGRGGGASIGGDRSIRSEADCGTPFHLHLSTPWA